MGILVVVDVGVPRNEDVRASIVIVTYNAGTYLEQCCTSLHHDIGSDDEIIVVDNASTDGSADLLQREWPEVKLIRNQINRGFAAACNQGASHANGQYLVFLNQDTQVLPGWLMGLLNVLETHTSAALVTSKLLLMSQPNRIQACGKDLHYCGMGHSRGLLATADRFAEIEVVGAVDGASFAARRDVWTEVGGFDHEFFMYFEEADLSWRVQLAGYQCVYAPTSKVFHDYPLGKPSGLVLYYSNRNRYVMLLKNWRWPTLLILGPGILLSELASWGAMIQAGWSGIRAKLLAWGWLLRNFLKILQLRQYSQTIRKVPDWVILEHRQWRIRPELRTGGRVGQAVTGLANVFLFANGWLAWRLCRLFGW